MKDDKSCCINSSKLSVCNFAVAGGVVCGLTAMIMTYLAMWYGIGKPIVNLMGSLYLGVELSIQGGLIGLFWGFVKGFVLGGIFAAVYNFCRCKCPCGPCKKNRK